MFSAVSAVDLAHCDLTAKENEVKWKGLFISGLKKVSQKRGHAIQAREDALEYLEKLIVQLLGMICNRPYPHTVPEVQERILRMLPPPIDQWVIDEATSAIKQGKKKAELSFPADKIHNLLQKDLFLHRVDHSVAVYISAVLEYIATDVLQLVGNYVKHSRHGEFSIQDIKAAMCCDKVLCDLFKLGDMFSVGSLEEPLKRNSLTYVEVAEDLLQSERQYLRDLQMLIKVFREELANKLEQENQNLELVFTSIVDITELTITLISTIEDNLEMTDSNHEPAIGICFLELAEGVEFDVYYRYAEAFNENCRQGLTDLLSRPDAQKIMSTAGHGFVEAVKFYFPKLLLEPFYHCMLYFDYIKLLYGLSPSDKDKTDLLQADGILTSLKSIMEKLIPNIPQKSTGDVRGRMSGKESKQIAQQKIADLKAQVEGFNDSIGKNNFNEFLFEGELQKVNNSGKRPSDRHGYLFDGCLFTCKPNYRRTSVVTGGPQHEYRLKESLYMNKVEVRDKEDTEEWKNLFEIIVKDQSPVLLSCRTREEKNNWMYLLVMLTTKSMLDRILDRILSDEEKKHPLQLPPTDKYRFSEEDSDANIVFDKDNGNHLIIKGATLLKLVERLTHHQYSDPNFINTFLTTYRSFCSPNEFLDLLIERYNIPDPELGSDELESIHERKMLKRFRKEYARHVKLRVLNVIKQWATHHYYDFERDPQLMVRLETFLDTQDETSGRNILESVRRSLRKAAENSTIDLDRNFSAVRSPPPIEVHIKCPMSEWNVLTLHPIELARQLTLLEFDLYRVVKPSELVGSVWTKKNKEKSSPNLLRMIKHTTHVTRWFERTIVDCENFDERVAVVSRILEVMMVLQELNNFNCVLAVVSAMGSASVHRLHFTFQSVSQRLLKALEEAQDLQNEHYKKYQERLRSINPPCVPFFGMYLTNILHIEDGNRDFLPNSNELINFSKRRKVAEITAEIRQFQYSHYCLSVEPKIREFIESLQPFEPDASETEISNYLYAKSLEIEPRGVRQPPRFARRWPDLSLKSPGIKPKNLPGKSHPGPLVPFASSSSSTTSASTMSLHSSISRMTLDSEILEACESSLSHTPKTLTPSSIVSATSPSFCGNSDYSIFVPVMIGSVPAPPLPPPPPAPPLPPRRKPEGSPALPPPPTTESTRVPVRDSGANLPPPPLPPRKVSPRTPNPPIPRRNSTTSEVMSPGAGMGGGMNNPAGLSSSPKRLTPNGPQIPHHGSPNGHCGAEHNCHRAFVFDAHNNHHHHHHLHHQQPGHVHQHHHPGPPVGLRQLNNNNHHQHNNHRVPLSSPDGQSTPPPQLPPRSRPSHDTSASSSSLLFNQHAE